MAKDRSLIYLLHPRFLFAHSTRVTGLNPIGDGYLLVRNTRLAP